MDDRIKLLAARALQLVADEHTNGDESRLNTDSYHVKDLINEKFAELIVRECSQYIEDKFDFCGDEIIVAEKLLEHFGVEEK
jgi:hypothetical protein